MRRPRGPVGAATSSDGKGFPCGDWQAGSSSGSGSSLGGNGEQDFYAFDSVDDARASLRRLTADLQSCGSSPVSVRDVAGVGETPVKVVVEGGDGGRVAWIVQRGAALGYIVVPGATTPPDAVSEAVGRLIGEVLSHGEPGPVPAQAPSPS